MKNRIIVIIILFALLILLSSCTNNEIIEVTSVVSKVSYNEITNIPESAITVTPVSTITPTSVPIVTPVSSVIPTSASNATSTPVASITPTSTPLPIIEVKELGLGRYMLADEENIIENDRFIITIGEGVVYPKEFEAFMNEVFNVMEKETGLSFFPIGFENKKVSITVSLDSDAAYGGQNGINIAQMDMYIYSGRSTFVYVHELHHVLQMRHCSITTSVFMEGHATYGTYILDNKLSIPNTFDTLENYYRFDNEPLMTANPEEYYLNVKGWDAYLYGFRMAFYLETIYGSNIHTNLIKKIQNDYGLNVISNVELVNVMKQMTSINLFDDFIKWYKQNKSLFSKDNWNSDFTSIKTYHQLPSFNVNDNIYNAINIVCNEEITIDFREGFGYLQQLGNTINGIYGIFHSEGVHTIEFYNNENELLLTQSINGNCNDFQVPGAVVIKVKGDSSSIHFVYYYSDMVYK